MEFVYKTQYLPDHLYLYTWAKHTQDILYFLTMHSNLHYEQLCDIAVQDDLWFDSRFKVVYVLVNPRNGHRISIVTRVDEGGHIPSATALHLGANWVEREIHDTYGIFVSDHSDLRRILTDYGFEGHPLRKDFPLTGYYEVSYSDSLKLVISSRVSLAQEFRTFEYNNPWGHGL